MKSNQASEINEKETDGQLTQRKGGVQDETTKDIQ